MVETSVEQARIIENPDIVHGRLLEAAHISGYSFERLCASLEWLLEEDRWRLVGGGTDDPARFLSTIDLSPFNMEATDRKRLGKLLTEVLGASQRATAKALGVAETTVARDLGKSRGATYVATENRGAAAEGGLQLSSATYVALSPPPPVAIGGREAAREIEKRHVAKVIREDRRAEKLADLEDIESLENKVAAGVGDVVVIDPPWPMEKIERDERPNQVEFDYPPMSEFEIGEYIEARAPFADNCHIWLWTTHRFLPMAFRLLDRWSLKYVCTFTWHKPGGFQPINLPQYNCEFALYARLGSPIFLDTKGFPVCFTAPRGSHSEKPEEFYRMVARATDGRRLDIFNRRTIEGFDGEGKEAA